MHAVRSSAASRMGFALPPVLSTVRQLRGPLAPRGMGDVLDVFASLLEGGGDPVTEPAPSTTTPRAGTPGAAPFRAHNWDFDRCEYMIAQGDTMWGLALTYLERGDRWQEISSNQNRAPGSRGPNGPYLNRYATAWDPSTVSETRRPYKEGDILEMPKEACDRAKVYLAAVKAGELTTAPATGGAPGTKPGAKDPTENTVIDHAKAHPLLIIAGIAAVAFVASQA